MSRSFLKWLCLLTAVVFSSSLWANEAIWIDVRSADEFAAGHVPDAVNIPYTEIESRIGEVTDDKEAVIYVYCRSGRRSGIAQSTLEQAGFTGVVNQGGLADARKKAAELADQ